MLIGGLEKLSLLDYPGKVAAIVFTASCNFRCSFCYNPSLVLPELVTNKNKKGPSLIPEKDLFLFLEERKGRLDGVVVTGGEPTLHADLPEFLKRIKALGYDVKLDTNGTNPKMLAKLIKAKLIDYVAMDLKAPLDKYPKVVATLVDIEAIKKSLNLLLKGSLPYEFRTTLVPGLHTQDDLLAMAKSIKGAQRWFLQEFKSNTPLVNQKFEKKASFSRQEMAEMLKLAQSIVPVCSLR